MKKLISIILSIIMAFSVLAVPVSAQDITTEPEIIETPIETDELMNSFVEVLDTVTLVLETVLEILKNFHELVGGLMAAIGEPCPLCEEMHYIDSDFEPEASEEADETTTFAGEELPENQ